MSKLSGLMLCSDGDEVGLQQEVTCSLNSLALKTRSSLVI